MKILPNFFSQDGPGAALAIAADGEEPFIECCGLADVERQLEITQDTVFDLASASKPFTAAAVLLLQDRKQLKLADPVAKHLPVCRDPEDGRTITVRDLLWHTSGLPDYLESGAYTEIEQLTPEYVVDQLPAWSREARPGIAHTYCNTNYFVLSKVVEEVSGYRFEDFVHSNLVSPFGLTNTHVVAGPCRGLKVARGYRETAYGVSRIVPAEEMPLRTLGDGGVYSSLNDSIRWLRLLWQGDIVSRESLALATTPGKLDSEQPFDYGCGLQVERGDSGQTWCGHGGSWTSSTVLLGRYVAERTHVIVLSNELMAPVEKISRCAIRRSSDGSGSFRPASDTS